MRTVIQSAVLWVLFLAFLRTHDLHSQNTGPASPERDKGWTPTGIGASLDGMLSGVLYINYRPNRFWQFSLNGNGELIGVKRLKL